ncbi:MAG TPA: A/G-specific adenine glycosylase [Acidimicrobiia bacterium]
MLRRWYECHGRHDLPWRTTRARWPVLVSEVMLHQTQVARVAATWPAFMDEFPTPATMAAGGPGAVIAAWGRLGYPRRARRLWEAAVVVAGQGWPDDLTDLPGIGRYTAAAIAAQADGADVVAFDVNVRRVVQRAAGRRLGNRDADAFARDLGGSLTGRDRLLALMDVGALLCRPRAPRCYECPLRPSCASRGPLAGERRSTQGRFEGSFRQRRGRVLAELRAGPAAARALDPEALASLVADGLASIDGPTARLP